MLPCKACCRETEGWHRLHKERVATEAASAYHLAFTLFFFCFSYYIQLSMCACECASGEFAGAVQLESCIFRRFSPKWQLSGWEARTICRADLCAYIKLAKKMKNISKVYHIETHDVSRPKSKMHVVQSFWCSSSEAVFCARDREWLVKKLSETLLSKLEFENCLTVSDELFLLMTKPLAS